MTEPTERTPGVMAEAISSLLVDTGPYLSCDDCFALIDAYVERRVADPDYRDAVMEGHLAGCGACAEEAETLRELLTSASG